MKCDDCKKDFASDVEFFEHECEKPEPPPDRQATLDELRAALASLPGDCRWYGWDDGSLTVTDADGNEIGYVNNHGAECGVFVRRD